jgi:serine/threonine protein phosphatase PrpC
LSRSNPLAEFLKNQKINMKDMKEEDFMAQYEAFMKANGYLEHGNGRSENKQGKNQSTTSDHTELRRKNDGDGQIKNIVLKFTTLSEGNVDAPSFTVDQNGAKIGRNTSNQICVPSDARLAPEAHSTIEFYRGGFYINDGGYTFSASIRIGLNNGHNKKWFMDKDARFSAGNSVIESRGVDERGDLELFVIEGPLKDKVLKINRKGATFGRSSDNHVCIPDRELSRKHSRIDFDERSGRYTVNDMGSTNGTYIQLVGPYSGRYKLSLNDHILVGRTGFSINRYDYGLSEEIGYRQTMEDACTIVQHLNIAPLCMPTLSPQSFFGVFDGHGGTHASQYLAQSLHVNVAHGLLDETDNIYKVIDECAPHSIFDSHFSSACAELDRVVLSSLRESFLKTDAEFIHSSPCPQHGSTATTALILGRRLYCANVGDSRTMICRNFTPILMSEDHKPYREDEAKRIKDAGKQLVTRMHAYMRQHGLLRNDKCFIQLILSNYGVLIRTS